MEINPINLENKIVRMSEFSDTFLHCHKLAEPKNGWIFQKGTDGFFYPYLVIDSTYTDDAAVIKTKAFGFDKAQNSKSKDIFIKLFTFRLEDIYNKTISEALQTQNIFLGTLKINEEYAAQYKRFKSLFGSTVEKQFKLNGVVDHYFEFAEDREHVELDDAKVIICTPLTEREDDIHSYVAYSQKALIVPKHPNLVVYDLNEHEYLIAHTEGLTVYRYDSNSCKRLFIPTETLESLNKHLLKKTPSEANVVVLRGRNATGRSETAEAFAEVMQKPLWTIRACTLGATENEVKANLKSLVNKANRFGFAILIKDADHYVAKKTENIDHSRLVAIFADQVRHLKGLMFITTNDWAELDTQLSLISKLKVKFAELNQDQRIQAFKFYALEFGLIVNDDVLQFVTNRYLVMSIGRVKKIIENVSLVHTNKNKPVDTATIMNAAR